MSGVALATEIFEASPQNSIVGYRRFRALKDASAGTNRESVL